MTEVKRRKRGGPAVVGIDQSLGGFGLCVLYRDGRHESYLGAWKKVPEHGIDRLAEIGMWLHTHVEAHPEIERVVMEGYARERRNGREEAGELSAIVRMVLRGLGHYPAVVSPKSLKVFVTGKGTAQKSDIKLHVFKRWGEEFASEDAADAYGLARMAAAIQWPGDDELTAFQREVLRNLGYDTER